MYPMNLHIISFSLIVICSKQFLTFFPISLGIAYFGTNLCYIPVGIQESAHPNVEIP
jgi:hypothetical protein